MPYKEIIRMKYVCPTSGREMCIKDCLRIGDCTCVSYRGQMAVLEEYEVRRRQRAADMPAHHGPI